MHRTRLPWLAALPLVVAGSAGAHLTGSLISAARTHPELGMAAEHPEQLEAHHHAGGLLTHLPPVAGLALAFVLVGLVAFVRSRRRLGRRDAGIGTFFLLPILGFALQEAIERVVHVESFPFHAVNEPRVLVGLLLQVPFGVAAYLLARLVVSTIRRVVRTLTAGIRLARTAGETSQTAAREVAWRPRIAILATGHSGRGPPACAV
jgi:hypothetical protein